MPWAVRVREDRGANGALVVKIPTFRRDLRREADLIEEVGRLVGLDRVPEVLPGVSLSGGLSPEQRRIRLLRHLLADLGLSEAVTYPFGPDRWTKKPEPAGGRRKSPGPHEKPAERRGR